MSSVPNSPAVTMALRDGALAAGAGSGADCGAVLGICTGGTPNTAYLFRSPEALRTALSVGPSAGPAVEAAALQLLVSGKPVMVVPVNPSVAGTVGSVTRTGTGIDPGAGFTGTPKDAYSLAVRITLAGAVGTARFRVAFDADNPDGPTWSDEYVTAASIANGPMTGSGLTLTFAAGSYVLGDTYTATCSAPGYAAVDVQNAFAALKATPTRWRFVHLVGQAANAAGSLTLATTLDTLLTGAQTTSRRYVWGLLQAADDTDSNLIAAFANFASRRVGVAAGFADTTSVLTGRVLKRGAAWVAAARLMKLRISQDAGEFAEGPLEGVQSIYRDEFATPALDAARFMTLRTMTGEAGYWINNPRLMAPGGSDFELIQYRQVMDEGCTIAQSSLNQYLNKAVLLNADGTISEGEALSIEAAVRADLAAGLLTGRHASAVSVVVDRTNNISTTKKLLVEIRITPLGYLKSIDVGIGFSNPKVILLPAAA